MKICFIVGAYPTMKCGVGDYTSILAEKLAKKENEVHVITSNKADASKSRSVKIHNIVNQWKLNAIRPIIKELKKIRPDVVNIQYPSNEYYRNTVTILPLLIKYLVKCKVTVTIHEYDYFNTKEKKSFKDKIRLCLNFCKVNRIVVVEKSYIDRIKADYPKANIMHISISSNIPKSEASNEELEAIRKNIGLEGKRIISYFGFATPRKGIEALFWCISKLDKDVNLLFINELNSEDEYHKSLLDLIEKLNIKDRVTITGFYDEPKDIANMLSLSDVCVLPFVDGVNERYGSFLAAYNQKIKVITTNRKGEKDSDGIYYVKPGDDLELLNKIKDVLDNNERFEREELTWEKVTDGFINAFNFEKE